MPRKRKGQGAGKIWGCVLCLLTFCLKLKHLDIICISHCYFVSLFKIIRTNKIMLRWELNKWLLGSIQI